MKRKKFRKDLGIIIMKFIINVLNSVVAATGIVIIFLNSLIDRLWCYAGCGIVIYSLINLYFINRKDI